MTQIIIPLEITKFGDILDIVGKDIVANNYIIIDDGRSGFFLNTVDQQKLMFVVEDEDIENGTKIIKV